ncbi:hypothetical protein [Paenibacillus nasutitermitis]|uniref:Lipoprotein n=1 Tax=Paenibacillus nasutitermitis TaxID=1652958 RepID=A0A917E0K0_9BACL|nr:hypothetical protein [Paenibacillus nasutitermitis]GGD84863.1 hypothetical protein GCM10010911_49040 [Paenibacillus nasutitermitis]
MRRISYILLFVTLITGCSQLKPNPAPGPEMETETELADYVNVGGKHYIHAWELAVANNSQISEIGKVESGSVIPEGTPVYKIAGYPEQYVIAVKSDKNSGVLTNFSGFLVYVLNGEDGRAHYPKIDDQQIKQIKIYNGSTLLQELKGEDVHSFLVLFNQEGSKFPSENGPEYTVLFIGDDSLGHNYGIYEKDGHLGIAHSESKLPDEIMHFFK